MDLHEYESKKKTLHKGLCDYVYFHMGLTSLTSVPLKIPCLIVIIISTIYTQLHRPVPYMLTVYAMDMRAAQNLHCTDLKSLSLLCDSA